MTFVGVYVKDGGRGTKRISFPWNTVVHVQQRSTVPLNITSDMPSPHFRICLTSDVLFYMWSRHAHRQNTVPETEMGAVNILRPSITVTQSTLSARFNPISHKHTRLIIQSEQGHSQMTIYSTCQHHGACVRQGIWLALVV